MKPKVYKPNGQIITTEPSNGTDFSLKELQEIVGGYIQVIYLPDNQVMVINEEGKLDGLEYNDNATEILEEVMDDFIVGNALICDRKMIT